ncbi:flavodoxin-dependent (E)-4-hydroxy-3-methylbut-2-enyl-diphosphate synthase [Lentisphaerota bacterium WC36G]|nr:flavodoxin-dependent (E)-4-hydroxy-3-methylbut-2-enyl-diphosphate synthase [Lentisphaerae bacterium WC36]
MRHSTKQIFVGDVAIGGDAPISIQSMTNTKTEDVDTTVKQILQLVDVGCEIIRVAVPNNDAVDALPHIINQSPIPVIADIHFDYKLALGAINAGAHAVRINPGNIGSIDKVQAVAKLANEKNIPIRVGANSGSLPKEWAQKVLECDKRDSLAHDKILAEGLVASVFEQIKILESCDFLNIKVSLKASSVRATFLAYQLFAEQSDYPLHIGVTEAGTLERGIIKSSVGIGALLLNGIGDTLRVSLTADPVEEIKVAKTILESCGLREPICEVVSCPTCGRTNIDLEGLANKVEAIIAEKFSNGSKQLNVKKVAVMGCVVNGPGEARDADLGIAGGDNKVAVFRDGEVVGIYSENEGLQVLADFITELF